MEGDKKRKRALSHPGRPPTFDSCDDELSESTPNLVVGVAPEPLPEPQVPTSKTGRLPGHPRRKGRNNTPDFGRCEHVLFVLIKHLRFPPGDSLTLADVGATVA